jgi:hypothetical protein
VTFFPEASETWNTAFGRKSRKARKWLSSVVDRRKKRKQETAIMDRKR